MTIPRIRNFGAKALSIRFTGDFLLVLIWAFLEDTPELEIKGVVVSCTGCGVVVPPFTGSALDLVWVGCFITGRLSAYTPPDFLMASIIPLASNISFAGSGSLFWWWHLRLQLEGRYPGCSSARDEERGTLLIF